MAGAVYVLPETIGFLPNGYETSTVALGPTAGLMAAFCFICPPGGATLSKVVIRVSAVTGALQAGDLRCDIYNDSSGSPGTSLGNTTTVDALPTGAAFVEFSGFSGGTSWTAGTLYWIVVSCPNAASSRYVTVLYGLAYTSGQFSNMRHETNGLGYKYYNASTWGSPSLCVAGARLEFSSPAIYLGNVLSSIGFTQYAYGTNAHGAILTTPANAKLRVRGIMAYLRKSGSPTYNIVGKLRVGDASATSSISVPTANLTAGAHGWQRFMFSSAVELNASTSIRIYIRGDGGTGTSDAVSVYHQTIHNSLASANLVPFNGTMKQTYTTNDDGTPPSWTEVNYNIPMMGLILDGDQEFGTISGGSGLIVHPGMSGGMRG